MSKTEQRSRPNLKFVISILIILVSFSSNILPSFPFIRLALTTDNLVVRVKTMWVRPTNGKSLLGNVRTIQVGWTRVKGCLQQDLKKRIRQDCMYYCYSILISFPFDPLSSFFLNTISRMPLL